MMIPNQNVYVVLGYAPDYNVLTSVVSPPTAIFTSLEEAQIHAGGLNNLALIAQDKTTYQVKTLAEYNVMVAKCVGKQNYSVFNRYMLLLEV